MDFGYVCVSVYMVPEAGGLASWITMYAHKINAWSCGILDNHVCSQNQCLVMHHMDRGEEAGRSRAKSSKFCGYIVAPALSYMYVPRSVLS